MVLKDINVPTMCAVRNFNFKYKVKNGINISKNIKTEYPVKQLWVNVLCFKEQ